MFTEFEFKNTDATIKEKIEVYGTSDEPWFKGIHIAKFLGYKNTTDAIIRHVNEDDKLTVKQLREKPTIKSLDSIGINFHDSFVKCDPQTIFGNLVNA